MIKSTHIFTVPPIKKLRSPLQRCLTVTKCCCIYSGIEKEVKPCFRSTSTDVEPDVSELHMEAEANRGELGGAAEEGCGESVVTFDPALGRGGRAG